MVTDCPSASGADARIQGNLFGTTADGNSLLTNAWEPLNLSNTTGYIVGTDGDGVDDALEGNWIVHRGDSLAMTLNSGMGLKESKDFVESLETELRTKQPERFTAPPAGKGCLGRVAVFAVGTLAFVGVLVMILHR